MKIKKSKIIFDFVIIPFLILLFSFDPFFVHGQLVSIDEGCHLSWINSIFRSQIPYRNTYLIYGLLYELIPASIMCLTGKSIVVLRAFHHFGMLLWLIIAYFFGCIILKKRIFAYLLAWLLIATRVWPFWSSRWGGIRNLIPFLVIAFLYLFNSKKKNIWLYLAGLVNGISILYAQDSGVAAFLTSVIFFTTLNWLWPNHQKGSFFKVVATYLSGMLTIIIPIFLYLGINNAISVYFKICFIDIPFKFPKYFVDVYPYMVLLVKTNIFKIFSNTQLTRAFLFCAALVVCITAFIYSIFFIVKKDKRREGNDVNRDLELGNVLILSVFAFFLLIFAIRQIHGMQFNIAAPPVVIVGCLLCEKIFSFLYKIVREKNTTTYKRYIAFLANVTIMLLISVSIYHFTKPIEQFRYLYDNILNYSNNYKMLRENFQILNLGRAKGIMVPKKQAEELEFVVNFIKEKTLQNEPIFVFPHNGEYYFLADRICASRFTLATFAMISPGYEDETIEDLERKSPKYVIYVRDAYILTDFHPVASEERIPRIFNYIKENYVPVASVHNTYILKLK